MSPTRPSRRASRDLPDVRGEPAESLAPDLTAFSTCLRDKEKRFKVAIVAVMRKLIARANTCSVAL